MSFSSSPSEPVAPATVTRPRQRGWPWLAWLVIVGVVGYDLWRHATVSPTTREKEQMTELEVQGRLLVGLHAASSEVDLSDQLAVLRRGGYGHRLRYAILAGELEGPARALETLDQLDSLAAERRLQPSPEQVRLHALLRRHYRAQESKGPGKKPLSEEEREEIVDRLGWFGQLALSSSLSADDPEREAVLAPTRRTLGGAATLGSTILLGAVAGSFLLLAGIALGLAGYLPGGMSPATGHGGIYAETFALYMALYLLLSVAVGSMARRELIAGYEMLVSAGIMLLSLGVLAWPLLRGVTWSELCADIGWKPDPPPESNPYRREIPWLRVLQKDGGPVLRIVQGLACYLCALPGLLVGILFLVTVQQLRRRLGLGPDELGPSDNPSHPITSWVAHGSTWVRLQVFFVAAVCAPIVEETMFRGVLYRHLRDALVFADGSRPRRIAGIALAMLVVSFVFAIIHPQGLLGVPALMSLALAFNLFREWRGSLVPSMLAHGFNNAVATLALILMIG